MTDNLFDALLVAWKTISSESDLKKLLEVVGNVCRTLTGATQASITLAEGQKLRFVFSTAQDSEAVKKYRIDFGEGIPGKVARTQEPIRSKNVSGELKHSLAKNAAEISLSSVLCVPMILQQRTFGTIQVFNTPSPEGFSDQDESRLKIFADQAAMAIEHFMLQDKLMKESRRVHGIFEALTDGIMVVDPAGNPLIYNKAIELLFFPEGKQNYALTTYLSTLLRENQPSGSGEVFLLKPHNAILSNRYVTVKDAKGNPSEIIVSIRNTTEQGAIDRRFSQFYAIMLRHSNRINLKAINQKKYSECRRLLLKQNEVLRHLVSLTELKSGPLRIEKENSNIVELYSKIRNKLVKRFEKASIRLYDEAILDMGQVMIRLETTRFKHVFRTLLRKGLKTLPEKGELRMKAWREKSRIFFEAVFLGKEIETKINPGVLEWNKQIDLVISGESKLLDFDLAFMKHIIHAHKGFLRILSDEPHKAVIQFDLPME